jgi:hypothetical protein
MPAIILMFTLVLVAFWPASIEAQWARCGGDFNGDGRVTVDELVTAVNHALHGCGLRYVDNGDGTITDTRTGLVWEKKSNDGSIHDKDDTYTWSTGSPYSPDGTAFTSFLATLNHSPTCFAGKCDWRLPNVTELQSLVDYGRLNPAIDPVFNTECPNHCTVMTCSCIVLDVGDAYYWSSATVADVTLPNGVWNVDFNNGFVNAFDKTAVPYYVRAVRGGL